MSSLVESCCNSLRDKFVDLAKSGESIEVTRYDDLKFLICLCHLKSVNIHDYLKIMM